MDGNRRWARATGRATAREGHRAGAEHLGDFLRWCERRDVTAVSVFVLSADNIRKRSRDELDGLFALLATVLPRCVEDAASWRLYVSGDLALIPDGARQALEAAVRSTVDRPRQLTLAVAYDARDDILGGIRSALRDPAGDRSPGGLTAAITAGLAGGPEKEIDLVIRTGGDHRISGFFPWQTQHAQIYFSPTMWPAFTERDLDAALADFAARRETGPGARNG